ncbi:MAG: DinB family protein [Acidobacteriales bacterium]|nr:DinB family protein [Terriglobales bacterium]
MPAFDLRLLESIVSNTPNVIAGITRDLPEPVLKLNEGPDTWSCFDVVGHLIHGEHTDWIPRTRQILAGNKRFIPFEREAMFRNSAGKSFSDLIKEFHELRRESVDALKSFKLTDRELDMTGLHPEFGEVTLRQHLASWATHDLGHIAQICRVLAKHWKPEIGPWHAYLSIVNWEGSAKK